MKKRVYIQVCLTILSTVVLASLYYYLTCLGLRNAKQDATGKYNYICNDTTHYSCVFFGASTIHVGINPLLFDSLTGQNSYNAAMDGIRVTEINLLIEKYVKGHRLPQNIFIAIDGQTLETNHSVWYFPQYFPFVNDEDLKDLIQREPKLLMGKYAPFAAITYLDDPLKNLGLIGLLNLNSSMYKIQLKGFLPAYWKGMKEDLPFEEVTFTGDKTGWVLLEKTLESCIKKNIRVNFIIAPRYNSLPSASFLKLLERLQSYESKYHTRLYNFIASDNFKSKELFPNRTHLNADGAQIFTTLLSQEFLAKEKEWANH